MLAAAAGFGAEPLSDEKQILKLEDDWVQALVSHDRMARRKPRTMKT